jgi:hypothetical protein
VNWTIDVANVGGGAAFNLQFTDTNPDGAVTSASFSRELFIVGERVVGSASYAVPADACPSDVIRNSGRANFSDITYRDPRAQRYQSVDSVTTRVLDIVPPELTLALTPTQLWPPNHKFVPIKATVVVHDNCDPNPVVRLISITSNEAANGNGDGNTAIDVQGASFGTADLEFQLRAERSGNGDGRIYTVTYEARDESGNSTRRTGTVSVNHNQ